MVALRLHGSEGGWLLQLLGVEMPADMLFRLGIARIKPAQGRPADPRTPSALTGRCKQRKQRMALVDSLTDCKRDCLGAAIMPEHQGRPCAPWLIPEGIVKIHGRLCRDGL